jgi:hypothetical protein
MAAKKEPVLVAPDGKLREATVPMTNDSKYALFWDYADHVESVFVGFCITDLEE